MRILHKLLLLSLLVTVVECKEEGVASRPYPRILTREVTNISKAGATFEADITYRGDFEILEHGFVWATETPTLDNGERIAVTKNPTSSHISMEVTARLYAKQFYQVRAYLITKDHIVLGNTVSFQSQGSLGPVLSDYYPKTARLTDTVTIIGKNFSRKPENNPLFFGNLRAPVISASDTLLRVIVPEDLTQTQAVVSFYSGQSHPIPFKLIIPRFLSVSPTDIITCDTVHIALAGLGPSVRVSCYLNDFGAAVISRSTDKLSVRTPVIHSWPSPVTIRVTVGLFDLTQSTSMTYTSSGIEGIGPPLASFLDTLIVHFYRKPACDIGITIDGKPIPILDSAGDYVRVIVPGEPTQHTYFVVSATVGGQVLDTYVKDRALKINSVTPASGSPGDVVTIRGIGFHPVLTNNIVCFSCQGGSSVGAHGVVLSGNTRELVVRIPPTAPNQIGITIFTQNLDTVPFPFEVH